MSSCSNLPGFHSWGSSISFGIRVNLWIVADPFSSVLTKHLLHVKRLWKALFAGDLTPHKGPLIIQPAFRATTSWKIKMTVMQEFKDFAIKGNVVDLAVGVIIGGAFGKIVDSVVSDLIMPIVGAVIGKLDFSNLFIVLGIPAGTATTLDGLRKAGVPVLAYGSFITIAVNFFILAFIIFMMIKQINRLKRESPAATTTTPAPIAEDIVLLREIRDSLKK
jgi:large conductance mechanosensitive channel